MCADEDFTVDTVLEYVKSCRICVDPNSGFLAQLHTFEKMVRNGEMRSRVLKFDQERQQPARESEEQQGFAPLDFEDFSLPKCKSNTYIISK